MAKLEPHEFVPPAEGTRDASFGWCARLDCGSAADSYVHASEQARAEFDRKCSGATAARSMVSTDPRATDLEGDAELLIRQTFREGSRYFGVPVDAGTVAIARGIVRDAYNRGARHISSLVNGLVDEWENDKRGHDDVFADIRDACS